MAANTPLEPVQFVGEVHSFLQQQDLAGLLSLLETRCTRQQLTDLLACGWQDARKVAALSLSLVGDKCCIPMLAERLKDPDPTINEMAEHALWCIWFRCGSPRANDHVCHGAKALEQRDVGAAIEHFNQAVEIDPTFAEAHNQRAIAYYLAGRYGCSLEDCRRAVALMPCHFGAWAGMGHCQAHMGFLNEAATCYRQALEINPHLKGVAEAVKELRAVP